MFKDQRRETNKIGRNEQYPCGSEKKYKKCCLNKNHVPQESEQKEQKMTTQTSIPDEIKTPTTVEEFRKNLKQYYVTIQENGRDVLVVRGMNIPLEEISSFKDIYIKTKSGWYGDGSSPEICPMITPLKDPVDYMLEFHMGLSIQGYFNDESNFVLWDNYLEFRKNGQPTWYSLDHHWLREFYMMTLGEFSGYSLVEEVVS